MAKEIDEKSKEIDEKVKGITDNSNDLDEKLKLLEEKIDEKIKVLEEKSKEIDEKTANFEKTVKEAEVKLPAINDKELVESAKKVGETLSKMDKVNVRIPVDEKNPEDKFVPVTISGYTYQIERGQSVEVPKEVERILIEAKYI